jgi:hypothetical protein
VRDRAGRTNARDPAPAAHGGRFSARPRPTAGAPGAVSGRATIRRDDVTYRIAIQPDQLTQKNGERQSFSARWAQLAAQAGMEVRFVDVYAHDLFERLAGCDGFMWRFGFLPLPRLYGKRLLPAIEHGLGIPVFPSWKSCWHFEDKVAQHYLLQAAGIPTPRTWVFWELEPALAFCHEASYPLVLKLGYGIQSGNVRLLRGAAEAQEWARRMFGIGVSSLDAPPRTAALRALGRVGRAVQVLRGRPPMPVNEKVELQRGYFYVQEFLEGNEFDTRVTVIGNRAFAFRRMNRPDDFRASGSGRIVFDPAQVDPGMVRLAFRVARRLDTQSLAIDGMFRGGEHVLSEISYTYQSWAVRDCPGHWELRGNPDTGQLDWCEGHLHPEDAIFADFAEQLAAVPAVRAR